MQIYRSQSEDGTEPVTDWLGRLRDKRAQARIRIRLKRLATGNFGDCRPVGSGVLELRIDVGPGYRVYLARHGDAVVLLLCGGDKRSQPTDIKRAHQLWANWKGRQP